MLVLLPSLLELPVVETKPTCFFYQVGVMKQVKIHGRSCAAVCGSTRADVRVVL